MLAHASTCHEDDIIRESRSLAKIVRCHDYFATFGADFTNDPLDHFGSGGIKARCRLVEQQQARPGQPGSRERKTLALPTRELAGAVPCPIGESNPLQHGPCTRLPLTPRHAKRNQTKRGILEYRSTQHDRLLEDHRHTFWTVIVVAPPKRAGRRLEQSAQDPQEHALAGPVRAEHYRDTLSAQDEIKPPQHRVAIWLET